MIDYLVDLWHNKRWLFWALLPLTISAVFVKFYMSYQMSKAMEAVRKTEDKDSVLIKESDKLAKEADKHLDNATKLEEKIKARNESDDQDLDWNKK
jgi:hypothetical protein